VTFRAGRLWNPLPPVDDVFTANWIAEKDGKWVSLFFPGWPLILAGVTSLHLPSFVASPALALLLLLAFSRLTCLTVGPAAALLGAALLSCCPVMVGPDWIDNFRPNELFLYAYRIPRISCTARPSGGRSGFVLAAPNDQREEVQTVFPVVLRPGGCSLHPAFYPRRGHFVGGAPFSFRGNFPVHMCADERVGSRNSEMDERLVSDFVRAHGALRVRLIFISRIDDSKGAVAR
jgi:hypothetical protein